VLNEVSGKCERGSFICLLNNASTKLHVKYDDKETIAILVLAFLDEILAPGGLKINHNYLILGSK